MEVEIISHTINPLETIVKCARTCYNSRDKDSISNRETFIKGLIKAGHLSVLENASVTFDVKNISRVCQNQVVRHRIGCSYCVESMRYVNVAERECVLPYKVLATDDSCYEFVKKSKDFYKKLIDNDVPKEDARMFLPLGMTCNMTITMNFRALRHFYKLRSSKNAQWEIRQLAEMMKDLAAYKWPWLFEGI